MEMDKEQVKVEIVGRRFGIFWIIKKIIALRFLRHSIRLTYMETIQMKTRSSSTLFLTLVLVYADSMPLVPKSSTTIGLLAGIGGQLMGMDCSSVHMAACIAVYANKKRLIWKFCIFSQVFLILPESR
jgi:hypothetical protein